MYEIGSEFHENSTQIGKNEYIELVGAEKRYVLSGRTAITYIIKDILSYSTFKKVALPEYCCVSMIKPFVSKGIEIVYYGIDSIYEEIFEQVEAVLIMDYFGIGSKATIRLSKLVKNKRKLLIVDATQTAFSRLETYQLADYILVSYRKWTDCLCAAVYSRNGFSIEISNQSNDTYVALWRQAAIMKRKYLFHGIETKEIFLDLYKRANRVLEEDYEDYIAPRDEVERFESIDSNYLRQRRRANGRILIEAIARSGKGGKSNKLYRYNPLKEEDCPLFVPLFVDAAVRDKVQKQLVNAGLFCPIHWPIDLNYPYIRTECHDCEISLICDQRYEEKEIVWELNEVLKAIENFEN